HLIVFEQAANLEFFNGLLKDFSRHADLSEMEPVDLNEAVENAIRLVRTTLRKSGVRLVRGLADGLPLVRGHLHGLEQVVVNLLLNAYAFVEESPGSVTVATRFDSFSNRVLLEVEDTGPGIEPHMQEHVFDPFFTTRQADGGTGLGLSVSYNLIQAHNGDISFVTEKGKGTRFTVSLPTMLSELKVLVVDDDSMLRDACMKILQRMRPYQVQTAVNGVEACVKLGAYRPDLLILDVVMPDMDGLEVCRVIREQPELRNMKVLVTSGHTDNPRLDEIRKLGFRQFLEKPFEMKKLLASVDESLGVAGGIDSG
ncbi:MAG: ATP-binding protein, partial [Desulfatibacillaceae bacterium]